MRIGARAIGPGEPCYVIAEAGVNHNGDLELAKKLVSIAAEAGADAVKFQTFDADKLVTETAPKARYQLETTGEGSQHAMLKRLELNAQAHRELAKIATRAGIAFLSTPFDLQSADMLERLSVHAFKIGSGDLTNSPLLRHVASKGRPMVVSTGMADIEEVGEAVRVTKEAGCRDLALLHCVSDYPARAEDANLRAMATLADAFGVPTGFSDHTLGIEVPLAAVAMGATIIEKHFTMDRDLPGPDHRASLEPGELRALVRGIRLVEAARGSGRKVPTPRERELATVARRSIVARVGIPKGSILSLDQLDYRRPGAGLPPTKVQAIVGRRTRVEIAPGSMITEEMLT